MKKRIILKPFKAVIRDNNHNFCDGLVLKRDLNLREAKHIVRDILGIVLFSRDDFCDSEEYESENKDFLKTVNEWIQGKQSDSSIAEYAGDCMDEQLGIFNAIKILEYLQKIKAI